MLCSAELWEYNQVGKLSSSALQQTVPTATIWLRCHAVRAPV